MDKSGSIRRRNESRMPVKKGKHDDVPVKKELSADHPSADHLSQNDDKDETEGRRSRSSRWEKSSRWDKDRLGIENASKVEHHSDVIPDGTRVDSGAAYNNGFIHNSASQGLDQGLQFPSIDDLLELNKLVLLDGTICRYYSLPADYPMPPDFVPTPPQPFELFSPEEGPYPGRGLTQKEMLHGGWTVEDAYPLLMQRENYLDERRIAHEDRMLGMSYEDMMLLSNMRGHVDMTNLSPGRDPIYMRQRAAIEAAAHHSARSRSPPLRDSAFDSRMVMTERGVSDGYVDGYAHFREIRRDSYGEEANLRDRERRLRGYSPGTNHKNGFSDRDQPLKKHYSPEETHGKRGRHDSWARDEDEHRYDELVERERLKVLVDRAYSYYVHALQDDPRWRRHQELGGRGALHCLACGRMSQIFTDTRSLMRHCDSREYRNSPEHMGFSEAVASLAR